MNSRLQQLHVKDESSGRWHIALVEGDKEPRFYDACNVVGARDFYHELPDGVNPDLLCKRCYGGAD